METNPRSAAGHHGLRSPSWNDRRAGSAELRQRAAAACRHAEGAVARARRAVAESRRLLPESTPAHPRYFVVRGGLDGEPVRAVWTRRGLLASRTLQRRGELLVSMGERFEAPERGAVVAADLGQPLPALLTLLRACDRVENVVFGPLPPGRSGP